VPMAAGDHQEIIKHFLTSRWGSICMLHPITAQVARLSHAATINGTLMDADSLQPKAVSSMSIGGCSCKAGSGLVPCSTHTMRSSARQFAAAFCVIFC